MSKKIVLLTLQTFSTTGGIQKMTRTLAYSLNNIAREHDWDFKLWSLYDSRYDLMSDYLSRDNFVGFSRNKVNLVLNILRKGRKADILIISHVNLALLGVIVKLLNPNCRVWLVAHGIEVWRPLSILKARFIKKYCDKIICVSNFTKQQMVDWHNVNAQKCIVLNNVVDPFIIHPDEFEKPEYLLNRYSLSHENQIIFTLTRLASTEQYKGYEQVIKAVSHLKDSFPSLRYILSGQYDSTEEARIRDLISTCNVSEQVILTGFLDEKELADYFLLADLFVLPSKKEGFGIVFIEALSCGLPVICGNADGSVDAIRNGELGTAIDVKDQQALEKAITGYLKTPLDVSIREQLQQKCLYYFNERDYQINLMKLINEQPIT